MKVTDGPNRGAVHELVAAPGESVARGWLLLKSNVEWQTGDNDARAPYVGVVELRRCDDGSFAAVFSDGRSTRGSAVFATEEERNSHSRPQLKAAKAAGRGARGTPLQLGSVVSVCFSTFLITALEPRGGGNGLGGVQVSRPARACCGLHSVAPWRLTAPPTRAFSHSTRLFLAAARRRHPGALPMASPDAKASTDARRHAGTDSPDCAEEARMIAAAMAVEGRAEALQHAALLVSAPVHRFD